MTEDENFFGWAVITSMSILLVLMMVFAECSGNSKVDISDIAGSQAVADKEK